MTLRVFGAYVDINTSSGVNNASKCANGKLYVSVYVGGTCAVIVCG